MKGVITSCTFLFAIASATCQISVPDLYPESGPYQVGFRHHLTFDSSRTYKRVYDWTTSHIPRPIPISIWYPSADLREPDMMQVMDYMEILKEEEEWEHLPSEQILNWFYYPNNIANQKHLNEHVTAILNAEPKVGRFPAVIYAPSYERSSIENFALCEYLASHGYVVISSPSRGTATRYLEGGTVKDLETQTRDMEFLLNLLYGDPMVDHEKIASMGFSFGGMSAVLLQMKNLDIKAIVSVDGSIKYQYDTFRKSPFADVDKVDVPLLNMAQKDIPLEVMEQDQIDPTLNHHFEFYDSLKYSEAYRLKLNRLTHSYFSSLRVLFETRDPRQDRSDEEIVQGYQIMLLYTRMFLDAYLLGDTTRVRDLLEFIGDAVDKGQVNFMVKHPIPGDFSFEAFNDLASSRRYQQMDMLYDSVVAINPDFSVPEGLLNNLGLQLVFDPETAQDGIRVLEWAVKLFPQSSNLFDSLAESYLHLGDEIRAKKNFQKALELNAANDHARSRLTQLEDK